MIKREEVEEALRVATDAPRSSHHIKDTFHRDLVAELARTWLRVNDAPVGEWCELTETEGIVTSAISGRFPFHAITEGQRVRLVPEADSGGEG